MTSWRESLTSIPGAVTHFLNESASTATSYIHGSLPSLAYTPTSSATPSSSEEIQSEQKSLPIPASLVKEQWRLIFTSDANAQDLQAAIAHCRDLVLLSDECSEERLWLVRHLVDLRLSLQELEEAEADKSAPAAPYIKPIVGHHFVAHQHGNRLQAAAKRYYCDHCTGVIWSVVQASYICSDCGYMVHQKCIDHVVRVCAHVIVSECIYPEADICPEIGLAAQHYKCAECNTSLNFKHSWIEPRLCDYTGLYYCHSCHWNDHTVIPARIVHNWDFTPKRVCRAALQQIQLYMDKPLIKLEERNPKLFVFLSKLGAVKKLRQNLVYMRKYLVECKRAIDEKLIDQQVATRRYLIQSNDFYSINDLVHIELGTLYEFLQKVFNAFERHIRQCNMCLAKAYICEICSNDEVIFPFDDCCLDCNKCNSIYHRVCMTRKNMICPKCMRLQERRQQLERTPSQPTENEDNDDD